MRGIHLCWSPKFLFQFTVCIVWIGVTPLWALREFRSWSNRSACDNAQLPGYIFAYSKYNGQKYESKGRTNTNLQDFRHECQLHGGASKCHICENIPCGSDYNSNGNNYLGGTCHLQLQGVSNVDMSTNIPVVTDTAWAVSPTGTFRKNFGSNSVTHICVFLSGGTCIIPSSGIQIYSDCRIRCFGYSITPGHAPVVATASYASHVDVYSGMPAYTIPSESSFDLTKPWTTQVDLWEFPRNCSQLHSYSRGSVQCTYNNAAERMTTTKFSPSFNPQGFLFSYAGSGIPGFKDGPSASASFFGPRGVAIDENGYLFVADTLNNAIRMVRPDGVVVTIAGKGPGDANAGWVDGPCGVATFTQPTDVAVKHDYINGVDTTIVLVADTGNHRIRKLTFTLPTAHQRKNSYVVGCRTSCLTGLCGNNTLSETDYHYKSSPVAGFADGPGSEARFSSPQGIAFLSRNRGDIFVVADTGNYLIRWVVTTTGNTSTLAGTVVPGERDVNGKPLPGCRPPCLQGDQGFNDGTLKTARFFNPVRVTRGPDDTVWVTDQNRIRMISLPALKHVRNVSQVFSIQTEGTVATIAGTTIQGREDGEGPVASFFESVGIVVSPLDDRIYVSDAASCHIRRITNVPQVAQTIDESNIIMDVIRPSGCTSYDQAIDRIGRKISRVEGNVQYNYGPPYEHHDNNTMWQQNLDRGKYIKNCVGVPPPDTFDKKFVSSGLNLVVDDYRVAVNEDSEAGMAIYVNCPPGAVHYWDINQALGLVLVEGTGWYSDESSICVAAVHNGAMNDTSGGVVQIVIERYDYLKINGTLQNYTTGTFRNNISSTNIPTTGIFRVFQPRAVASSVVIVHSIAGAPSAPLESACGLQDAQPPQFGRMNSPQGMTARTPYLDLNPLLKASTAGALSDINYLFIADAGNHRVRGLSAVCTMICENGGRCVGSDTCLCPTGWTGMDCSTPVCSTPCPFNQVCVAPNTCSCRPGFSGFPLCAQAMCHQGTCHNGGTCSLPDTCACAPGWFDSNCTTPVCTQTCGNGGRCIGQDACWCPSQWTGSDCRIPKCEQTCHHGGLCVAPNTCQCPPQYTNYDCSVPTCQQGFFARDVQGWTPPEKHHIHSSNLLYYPTYKACKIAEWCNATNEFECQQLEMSYIGMQVPSGPSARLITGRKYPPDNCMLIELPLDYKLPFELLLSDNSTTGYWRFSPNTPYTSNASNPWGGILQPQAQHTPPYIYTPDRQLAWVSWNNVSQGVYTCANGGNCTAPDTCECAKGWIGFDCRTPVCEQGYFRPQQRHYVSGLEIPLEVTYFDKYMGNPQYINVVINHNTTVTKLIYLANNSYRLHWPYSNPNYTMQIEFYSDTNVVIRPIINITAASSYEGPSDWSSGRHKSTIQGGYRCSIRASTRFENLTYVWNSPNYYSRYMDYKIQKDGKAYTSWRNLFWPPVTQKSRILEQQFNGQTYQYTNEGYRKYGIWNITQNKWTYGTCLLEFSRNCSNDPTKQVDLHSNLNYVYVQDTDLAYRPRVFYDDHRVYQRGRWSQLGGECVDQVIHGCFNNGTCIGPNMCACQGGWIGYSCEIPTCKDPCQHNGVCTGINECTCEKGWEGPVCSKPMCAQECQNHGKCVAPDTCQCYQWPNTWVDGRLNGGHPLYQDLKGDPLPTGWTGMDCSVPICTQAQEFLINTLNPATPPLYPLGGHGGDGLLGCTYRGKLLPRCPMYDATLTSNNGQSFLSGCGFDPYDTGCCNTGPGPFNSNSTTINCFRCKKLEHEGINQGVFDNHTYFCTGPPFQYTQPINNKVYLDHLGFVEHKQNNYLQCGKFHQPRYYLLGNYLNVNDYGVASYYKSGTDPNVTNLAYKATTTSNRFLCNVVHWTQGDYIDDAGLGLAKGVGSIYVSAQEIHDGLSIGRHVRINTPNIFYNAINHTYESHGPLPGEGLYACYHGGSCIAPDICTCTDGYTGFDCRTPLCRHLQPTGIITSCLNGGECIRKDYCVCAQTDSILYQSYPDAPRGPTGWTGTDCSMPMCTQGRFDPACTGLPQAPGGEGCYRCANGGNCTAPDVCTCAPGWTGYDCRTPKCEVVADPLTRTQLGTVYEYKVISFETDPCGLEAIYGLHGWLGRKYARGNCTLPNECTCLCKMDYNKKACKKYKKQCDGPWQDNLVAIRNLLTRPEYTFGSTWCQHGYEGNVDPVTDRFVTCHQTIYIPTNMQSQSLPAIAASVTLATIFAVIYYFISARLKRRFLLAKIERRKSRRSSDESITNVRPGGS